MAHQENFTIQTSGRGMTEITRKVQGIVADSGIQTGLCHIYQHHTSASLFINENADPAVQADLQRFMEKLVIDDDPDYSHRNEGPDDMSAHIRSVLTHNDLTVPVAQGQCALGTWQGIFLWEHRAHAHSRKITVTVL